jgi:hypothetical protein
MRFASPWDRRLRIVTAISAIVLAAVVVFVAAVLATTGLGRAAVLAAVLALASLTLGLSWGLAPTAFAIEHGMLRIERPMQPIEIPLASIRAAGPLGPAGLGRSLRIAGSGGLFGYYGLFWSRRLGAYRLYATRTSDLVRVDTDRERFVLSPEPAGQFLELLQSRAPAWSFAEPEPRPVARRVVAALVAAILLTVGAVVAAAVGAR